MFDASKDFDKFYKNDVVLPQSDQQELRDKKRINVDRLKSGLKTYNDEYKTDYKVAEDRVQGSMAMSTVIQNDKHDYDIDVAIIFDKSNIGDMGPLQARRLVKAALDYKSGQFTNKAEVKTNCVRIRYQDGYHVDFAVYRRYRKDGETNYTYEHAGTTWSYRDPAAITDWFLKEIKDKGTDLRKVIRLSKMFCKSRDTWVNLPGGLIQSVVIDECFNEAGRIDEIFYNTMVAVHDRLEKSNEVCNPTDPSISILTAQNHYDKVKNWCSRLGMQLDKLSVLFEDGCTRKEALDAWYGFFNHSYWSTESAVCEMAAVSKAYNLDSRQSFRDTEQFIEDQGVIINDHYWAQITCEIESKGFRKQPIDSFFSRFTWLRRYIPRGPKLYFELRTDAPSYDAIWWKVRNVGAEAERRNDIRGQIEKQWGKSKTETSKFVGPHYVEAYVIKGHECIAMAHYNVPIGNSDV